MRALIVLGGDAPGAQLLKRCASASDLVIAADRGLEAFASAGIVPDLLIGDLDSVSGDVLKEYTDLLPIRKLQCEKDDTDGVDALDVAVQRGADDVLILGALGGRLDHALANLMLLVRAHQHGVRAQILDEQVRIFRVDAEAELIGAQGDTVSLLPLGEAHGVTVSGLHYPLEDGMLRSDHPLGISNVVAHDRAYVSVRGGDLILFHYYQQLERL